MRFVFLFFCTYGTGFHIGFQKWLARPKTIWPINKKVLHCEHDNVKTRNYFVADRQNVT